MAITSLKFFAFLAVIYLLYCLVPRQKRWFVLLGASLFFYVVCGSLRLFVRHTLTDPRGIWRGNPDGQAAEGGCFYKDKYRRDPYLSGSAFSDRGALLYYKEMNFFVTNGNILLHLLGKESTLFLWQIVAPLGISYYTLSYIAYILDVYWGVVSPAEEFFEVLPFWHLLSDHDLWSDHTVSGDRTGFVCGKQS